MLLLLVTENYIVGIDHVSLNKRGGILKHGTNRG
jgi:hypothetical protein